MSDSTPNGQEIVQEMATLIIKRDVARAAGSVKLSARYEAQISRLKRILSMMDKRARAHRLAHVPYVKQYDEWIATALRDFSSEKNALESFEPQAVS